MQSVKRLISERGRASFDRLDAAAAEPGAIQRKVLNRLIRKNEDTAFGRRYGFANVRNELDYRRQVPIQDFEGFRPYVNRIMSGEERVLTSAEPLMLNQTSGTTGEPKYIPVTQESLSQGSELMLQWLYLAWRDHPALLNHAFVGIVSRAVEGHTGGGLPFGSASGLIYNEMPEAVHSSYAIPCGVLELRDYELRSFILARLALGCRVSLISTPNPSTHLRLAETLSERGEELIRAIRDGKTGVESAEQPEALNRLEAELKPDLQRAEFLSRILAKTGGLRPVDCWPDLALLGSWLGGSVGIQARKLVSCYGDVPIRDLGYLASEGHFTVPFQDRTPAGILALHSNYYEFIPEDRTGDSEPPVLSGHELEEGRRYGIILTTTSGLYRYNINDIVEVQGFYRAAPLLAFIGKGSDVTSITGEKLHVNHILQAFDEVRQQYNLSLVEQFRIVPDYEEGRYDIFVELNSDVSHDLLREDVLPALDRALSAANVEYEQKRSSRRLHPPRLHLMRRGWAKSEIRRSATTGKREAQYKWPILHPERLPEDTRAVICTIESPGMESIKVKAEQKNE